ncbi:MAG: hypothetical protein NTU69_00925 [Proteobacteria bacterium]|nr:hypothetical protein [Pseudomonadota bacterium]
MSRGRKIGIMFIIIGTLIPLVSLLWVTGYDHKKGIISNIYNVSIVLREEKSGNEGAVESSSKMTKFIPKRLPYRFILALGIFLVFIGILRLDLST